MVFALTPSQPVHAQDENCDATLLADVEQHLSAMYFLTELERPGFQRIDYIVSVLTYANKLVVEEDTCGLGVQARILAWAFEVYRVEADYQLKIIDQDMYNKLSGILLTQRESLYEQYCAAFPIACRNGAPVTYDELLAILDAPTENAAR